MAGEIARGRETAGDPGKDSTATEAPKAPVTHERRVRDDLEKRLVKPYLARALEAVDAEHPDGSPDHQNKGMSVLQQHVAFFDDNGDGIIYPWETYRGMRRVGFNPFFSAFLTLFIMALSYRTLPTWIPHPLFPVYINNIHKTKHGSDTATFDTEGRFMPMNFENIFSKYARKKPDKLCFSEIWEMVQSNRLAFDPLGGFAAKLEWVALFILAKDGEGYLSKEDVRRCYDGSLFEHKAKMNEDRRRKE